MCKGPISEITKIFASAKMNVREFLSNDPKIMTAIKKTRSFTNRFKNKDFGNSLGTHG